MINKLRKALAGVFIMLFKVKFFQPAKIFLNKRVAVVGAADSAFENENGLFIDSYDIVIRMNKALVTWDYNKEKFLGRKTEVLLHNFHENLDSGGAGPINWNVFDGFGLKYLVQPRFDKDGWRSIFNYFKKYLNYKRNVFILPAKYYADIKSMFGEYHPTKGFCAIYCALNSTSKEVFLTGFTFFKTPYGAGYRDNIRDVESNKIHIANQGLHSIELEYQNFIVLLKRVKDKVIIVDPKLYAIVKENSPDVLYKLIQKG